MLNIAWKVWLRRRILNFFFVLFLMKMNSNNKLKNNSFVILLNVKNMFCYFYYLAEMLLTYLSLIANLINKLSSGLNIRLKSVAYSMPIIGGKNVINNWSKGFDRFSNVLAVTSKLSFWLKKFKNFDVFVGNCLSIISKVQLKIISKTIICFPSDW